MSVESGFIGVGLLLLLLILRVPVALALIAVSFGGVVSLLGIRPAVGILLRFATGFFLAGVYPPAFKLMSTWFRGGRGLALGILGVGNLPQFQSGTIALVPFHKKLDNTRPIANRHRKNPCCQRIKSAGVPYPSGLEQPAHAAHHIVGGYPLRLVNDQQSVHRGGFLVPGW